MFSDEKQFRDEIKQRQDATDTKHLIDQMIGNSIETKTELNLNQIQSLCVCQAIVEKNPVHHPVIKKTLDYFLRDLVSHDRKSRSELVKMFADIKAGRQPITPEDLRK